MSARNSSRAIPSDVVTWKEILSSACAKDPLLLELASHPRERAWFERDARQRAVHRQFREDIDAGIVPEWERALVHLVAIQDVLRIFAGRLRTGDRREGSLREPETPRGLLGSPAAPTHVCEVVGYELPPEPTREERERYIAALQAEEVGYEHDPSWTNGGLASHGAEPIPDDELKRQGKDPGVELLGVFAFAALEAIEAIPELGWFYSGSARDLGVQSSHASQVHRMLVGSAHSPASGSAPEGPTDKQIEAANMQRAVRLNLGRLPVHLQGDLELAYTDRRYDNHLVSTYGIGLAPLIWRAAERAGDVSKDGRVTVTNATLDALVEDVRREWRTYEGSANESEELHDRVRRAAKILLWHAHEEYRVVAGLKPLGPKRKRRKQRVFMPLPSRGSATLLPAPAQGNVGTKRRRLREVPRRAA